jgi:phenylalanyl-tRNA synthetase alpha chain
MEIEARKSLGIALKAARQELEEAFRVATESLSERELASLFEAEAVDVGCISYRERIGKLAPVTETLRVIYKILKPLGFELWDGPEVETDYYNFEAVNIPANHPAREMQDTFFVGPERVLRTHTSSIQMRALRDKTLPLRILAPGAVHRCDYDATHTPMFHQVEGLWIDRDVTLAHLKGVLEHLARELFGERSKVRLRPSFFPVVEPGCEVDVSCFNCKGDPTCRVCKGTTWLEILGAGMVHPELLKRAGISHGWTGFAFGLGLERIAMLRMNISDIRELFEPKGERP